MKVLCWIEILFFSLSFQYFRSRFSMYILIFWFFFFVFTGNPIAKDKSSLKADNINSSRQSLKWNFILLGCILQNQLFQWEPGLRSATALRSKLQESYFELLCHKDFNGLNCIHLQNCTCWGICSCNLKRWYSKCAEKQQSFGFSIPDWWLFILKKPTSKMYWFLLFKIVHLVHHSDCWWDCTLL